jgi:hypothetical protein
MLLDPAGVPFPFSFGLDFPFPFYLSTGHPQRPSEKLVHGGELLRKKIKNFPLDICPTVSYIHQMTFIISFCFFYVSFLYLIGAISF